MMRPLGEVLPTIEVFDDVLKPDDLPVEAIVLVKYVDADGDTGWCQIFTPALSEHEAIGALVAATDIVRANLQGRFAPHKDDD